jgi:hypothetical protein
MNTAWLGPDDGVVFCESPTDATALAMVLTPATVRSVLPTARWYACSAYNAVRFDKA